MAQGTSSFPLEQAKASPEVAATVLCVEDEEPQLKLRKLLLESAGFKVVTAESAKKAIELLRTQHVDAAIVDYWMPGMNGLALAREIKRVHPNTPVIIFSAYTYLPDEVIGSADLWLRKAEVDPDELLAHIRQLIAKHAS
jgi:DNA-binding response OmpR family regulator